MQSYTTILGVIDMRQRGISYDDYGNRYGIGHSTITLIMDRFRDSGKNLDTLKQMSPEEVENLFYPPENIRRKDVYILYYQYISSKISRQSKTQCQLFINTHQQHAINILPFLLTSNELISQFDQI